MPRVQCTVPGCNKVYSRQSNMQRHLKTHEAAGELVPDMPMDAMSQLTGGLQANVNQQQLNALSQFQMAQGMPMSMQSNTVPMHLQPAPPQEAPPVL